MVDVDSVEWEVSCCRVFVGWSWVGIGMNVCRGCCGMLGNFGEELLGDWHEL